MYMRRASEEINDSPQEFGHIRISFEVRPLVYNNQTRGEHMQPEEPIIQKPPNDYNCGIQMEEEEDTIKPESPRPKITTCWHKIGIYA